MEHKQILNLSEKNDIFFITGLVHYWTNELKELEGEEEHSTIDYFSFPEDDPDYLALEVFVTLVNLGMIFPATNSVELASNMGTIRNYMKRLQRGQGIINYLNIEISYNSPFLIYSTRSGEKLYYTLGDFNQIWPILRRDPLPNYQQTPKDYERSGSIDNSRNPVVNELVLLDDFGTKHEYFVSEVHYDGPFVNYFFIKDNQGENIKVNKIFGSWRIESPNILDCDVVYSPERKYYMILFRN